MLRSIREKGAGENKKNKNTLLVHHMTLTPVNDFATYYSTVAVVPIYSRSNSVVLATEFWESQ
jgi:hypothetical protein